MSPTPGRSTLMTSAPIYASSCVQVGPDCTWVKSRMRTPSSALPAWPHGFDEGRGAPFAPGFFAARPAFNPTTFRANFFAAVLFLDRAASPAAFLAFLPPLFVRVAIAVLLELSGRNHAAMKITSCAAHSAG